MSASFEELLAQIEHVITGREQPRDFVRACELAKQIVSLYPTEPRGWGQLVLTLDLTDQHYQALAAQQTARQECGERWTVIDEGDCERDHALYCIRHREFAQALKHLASALRCHWGDSDRMAALAMVEARLWLVRKEYVAALSHFARAIQLRELKRARTNQQWRFNCDRWMLLALVARFGKQASVVTELRTSLQGRMDQHGSPDINARLAVVMRLGRLGVWCDLFIESSPVGRSFLANRYVRRKVQRFLTKR